MLFCDHLRSFVCFCERPRLEQPRLGTADKAFVIVVGIGAEFWEGDATKESSVIFFSEKGEAFSE